MDPRLAKIALNSRPSCFHSLSTEITGMWSMKCWGLNPGLCDCQASTLPIKWHSHLTWQLLKHIIPSALWVKFFSKEEHFIFFLEVNFFRFRVSHSPGWSSGCWDYGYVPPRFPLQNQFLNFYSLYMCEFLHVCICTVSMPSAHRGQKRAPEAFVSC